MQTHDQATRTTKQQRVTFDLVIRQLHTQHFAVVSTVDEAGNPHSAGVNYGVSRPGHPLALYVMTRRHLKKTRNIAQNPRISLVIPVARRLLWFLPPATIQVRGHAELLDWTDAEGTEVFKHFWMGRRILKMYNESYHRGETRICFLKITPDADIATYMVGYSVWEARKHMESASAKVAVPSEYRPAEDRSSPQIAQAPAHAAASR
jgi:nitroimidazol reductase NimA-like FMN-containing flavoprotein (pyridoxamine 5'-phosphate oxidase superfamily)